MSNEQTGKPDQPHALSDEAELMRARLRTAACCGRTVSLNVPEVRRLLAILDAHANDLADMRRICSDVEEVYHHVTEGRLSKYNTNPIHIKVAHDEALERAERGTRKDDAEDDGGNPEDPGFLPSWQDAQNAGKERLRRANRYIAHLERELHARGGPAPRLADLIEAQEGGKRSLILPVRPPSAPPPPGDST